MRSSHDIIREQEENEKVFILNTITERGAFQCKKALMYSGWDVERAIKWLKGHSDSDMYKDRREIRRTER